MFQSGNDYVMSTDLITLTTFLEGVTSCLNTPSDGIILETDKYVVLKKGVCSITLQFVSGQVPSCQLGEHMVSIIQIGKVGSKTPTAIFAIQRAPVKKNITL